MKRQKLLNKRILAFVLSAAMVFAQADTYAVMAAAPENPGEAVEYNESQSVLTEDLEADESGKESGSDESGGDGQADDADQGKEPGSGSEDGSNGPTEGEGETIGSEGETTGGEGETTGGEGGTTEGEGGTTEGEGETTGGEGETTGGEGGTTGGEGGTTGGEGGTTGGEGEENGTKQEVFISAVTISNKEYDGNPVSYIGSPDVKDSEGNTITDVTASCSYTGTLANGSVYEKPAEAPSQAGSYTLTVTIPESDKYTAEAVTCSFEITRKAITITAPSLSIKTGEALPALSSLTATVEGLLNGDTVQPQFKYGTDNISTKVEGTYDIIPYDADAGNNYSISYVNGTLTITKAQIVHEGTSRDKKLTWTIDDAGRLTVKGTGNYPTTTLDYEEEWGFKVTAPEWCRYAEDIETAEISVSGITTTENMFYGCYGLKSIDLTNLDTSKVNNMQSMFGECLGLTSLDLSSFNTSKVTNMDSMFSGCGSLTSLDLSSFNTSNVTNMVLMFQWCENMTSLDVSSFNTNRVTKMWGMFANCESLTNLDLSSFNTSKVKDMYYVFYDCQSLTSLDLSSFNTSNVYDMSEMFWNCKSLADLNLSSFNTKKVTSIQDMFYGCASLASLDLSSFDIRLIEDDENAGIDIGLYGCNSLSYIRTPKNCSVDIILPTGASGTDKWYQALDTPCTTLPKSLSTSIDLYKNGYPGDGTIKKLVSISGVSISSMVYNGRSAKLFGTPLLMDSGKNKITDAILNYSYTGTLADGRTYAETTQAPSEAGNYKLLIKTESNDYSGQASYSFSIEPKTVVISAESVSIENGEELPALTDQYTVSGLLEGDTLSIAPTLAYSENNIQTASAGRYVIIPSGAFAGNNYRIEYKEGTLTVGDPDDDTSFGTEERTDLASLGCTIAPVRAKNYDGAAYEPVVRVTVTENGRKKTLAEGTDYRVLYKDNVNAGTGKVIVRGSGVYKGNVEAPILINPKVVKRLKVVTGGVAGTISEDAVNNGSLSLPVYIYDGSKLLTRGKDYTLTYVDVKRGTLTVKIKGMDGSNYTGENTAKITVYDGTSADKIINPDNVNLKSYTEKYTGKAVKPLVEVKINGEVISNKNYRVQYQNNINAGTAYVIVTGKGTYKGKVVTAFEITANTQRLFITNTIKAQNYNGRLLKPSVTVTAGNKRLRKNTDYVITYKNNLHAGTATVTVTGKGNYTGTAATTFIINPLKASRIAVKGTWKDSNGDGVRDGGALTVTFGKRLLKEGVDYTLEEGEIKNNKIKITFKGAEGSDFTDSVVKTLKME